MGKFQPPVDNHDQNLYTVSNRRRGVPEKLAKYNLTDIITLYYHDSESKISEEPDDDDRICRIFVYDAHGIAVRRS